jgi:hypothetical protein
VFAHVDDLIQKLRQLLLVPPPPSRCAACAFESYSSLPGGPHPPYPPGPDWERSESAGRQLSRPGRCMDRNNHRIQDGVSGPVASNRAFMAFVEEMYPQPSRVGTVGFEQMAQPEEETKKQPLTVTTGSSEGFVLHVACNQALFVTIGKIKAEVLSGQGGNVCGRGLGSLRPSTLNLIPR